MQKRLPYEALIGAALLLGSCNERRPGASDAYDLADTADANARTALSRVEELEAEVRDLRDEVERLDEREQGLTDAAVNDLRAVNERVTQFQDYYNNHTHR